MPVAIRLKEREPFESVLRRFKKQCEKEGVFQTSGSGNITRNRA